MISELFGPQTHHSNGVLRSKQTFTLNGGVDYGCGSDYDGGDHGGGDDNDSGDIYRAVFLTGQTLRKF